MQSNRQVRNQQGENSRAGSLHHAIPSVSLFSTPNTSPRSPVNDNSTIQSTSNRNPHVNYSMEMLIYAYREWLSTLSSLHPNPNIITESSNNLTAGMDSLSEQSLRTGQIRSASICDPLGYRLLDSALEAKWWLQNQSRNQQACQSDSSTISGMLVNPLYTSPASCEADNPISKSEPLSGLATIRPAKSLKPSHSKVRESPLTAVDALTTIKINPRKDLEYEANFNPVVFEGTFLRLMVSCTQQIQYTHLHTWLSRRNNKNSVENSLKLSTAY